MSADDRKDGPPADRPRQRGRHQTDVDLAAAALAFRRRPLRISADDLAAPLRCSLRHAGALLGQCPVLDVSGGGVGIRLVDGLTVHLHDTLDEVRLEQGDAIVAHGPAQIVNVIDGPDRRAGLRFTEHGIELRNLRLRDGAPVDPGGASPEAAALPADWRAAVAELGQILRWSGFFLDHATRPMGDQLTPAHERAVFDDFYVQWAPRALGSLARLHDLSTPLDERQREAAREHARHELLGYVYPGQLPLPPEHGAIDDHGLPSLYLAPGFDASTLHARFLRYAWPRFPLIRTILGRPAWLGELWNELPPRGSSRVLVVQPGPAAELSHAAVTGSPRVELMLLETDASTRATREPAWRDRWRGPGTDLTVGTRPPTGIPAVLADREPYDLVYGAGVLGGLRNHDARSLVRSLFALLKPGGRLVLGNLMVEPATSWLLDYAFGWPIVYRDPAQLRALAKGLAAKSSTLRVDLDPTGRAAVLDVVR